MDADIKLIKLGGCVPYSRTKRKKKFERLSRLISENEPKEEYYAMN